MDLATFVSSVWERRVTADGGLGGQCVDVANLWRAHIGLPPVRRNAADWAGGGPGGSVAPGMAWEGNAPYNAPPPGALVVWRAYAPMGIGAFGHIALCVAADSMALLTLDQNWAGQERCLIVCHTYGGVAGWQYVKP